MTRDREDTVAIHPPIVDTLGAQRQAEWRQRWSDSYAEHRCTPACPTRFTEIPGAGNRVLPGVPWIADNAVFANKYPGDDAYLTWLGGLPHRGNCRFAVAPDVVGDATATLARSLPMLGRIRALGIPVAYAAQDGATIDSLPWADFDVLFIGGSTGWKIGAQARTLIAEAKRRGLAVHMGRVNSHGRLQRAADSGCDSADGTYLAFGPDANLPRLLRWVAAVNHPALWETA